MVPEIVIFAWGPCEGHAFGCWLLSSACGPSSKRPEPDRMEVRVSLRKKVRARGSVQLLAYRPALDDGRT